MQQFKTLQEAREALARARSRVDQARSDEEFRIACDLERLIEDQVVELMSRKAA